MHFAHDSEITVVCHHTEKYNDHLMLSLPGDFSTGKPMMLSAIVRLKKDAVGSTLSLNLTKPHNTTQIANSFLNNPV